MILERFAPQGQHTSRSEAAAARLHEFFLFALLSILKSFITFADLSLAWSPVLITYWSQLIYTVTIITVCYY